MRVISHWRSGAPLPSLNASVPQGKKMVDRSRSTDKNRNVIQPKGVDHPSRQKLESSPPVVNGQEPDQIGGSLANEEAGLMCTRLTASASKNRRKFSHERRLILASGEYFGFEQLGGQSNHMVDRAPSGIFKDAVYNEHDCVRRC
jgi:hypothetical protein